VCHVLAPRTVATLAADISQMRSLLFVFKTGLVLITDHMANHALGIKLPQSRLHCLLLESLVSVGVVTVRPNAVIDSVAILARVRPNKVYVLALELDLCQMLGPRHPGEKIASLNLRRILVQDLEDWVILLLFLVRFKFLVQRHQLEMNIEGLLW